VAAFLVARFGACGRGGAAAGAGQQVLRATDALWCVSGGSSNGYLDENVTMFFTLLGFSCIKIELLLLNHIIGF
jgi:hypothetical protein